MANAKKSSRNSRAGSVHDGSIMHVTNRSDMVIDKELAEVLDDVQVDDPVDKESDNGLKIMRVVASES
jgi:hypothetical protein